MEGGEKEQEEDLHPGQLSTLAWPSRRQQSLKEYKGKGPHEYLSFPHAMRAGMESKGCAGGTPTGVTASSQLPVSRRTQDHWASKLAVGWKDVRG